MPYFGPAESADYNDIEKYSNFFYVIADFCLFTAEVYRRCYGRPQLVLLFFFFFFFSNNAHSSELSNVVTSAFNREIFVNRLIEQNVD